MRVGIVSIAVVGVLGIGFLGGKLFEPFFIVRMKSTFVVVYKDR